MSQIELAPQVTTMEAQNPLVIAGVAMQEFAGRIGASLRSGIEAVREAPRSIKTLTAVGTTALALFGASQAEAANADTLEATCVKAALSKPTILKTGIKHAGTLQQTVYMGAQYESMPEDCIGTYYRGNHAKAQLFRNGRWASMAAGWEGVYGGVYDDEGHLDKQGAFEGTFVQARHGNEKPWYFHPCRVRILLKENVTHQVRHADTGYHPTHNIDQQIYTIPVTKFLPHEPEDC